MGRILQILKRHSRTKLLIQNTSQYKTINWISHHKPIIEIMPFAEKTQSEQMLNQNCTKEKLFALERKN